MEFYLLLLGIMTMLIGYLKISIDYIKYKSKNNSTTAFELSKEITSDYDNINIVESSEIIISKYHLKRKVIRLTKKMYSAKDTFSLALATYLSCISLSNSKYLEWLSKVISSIDYLNKSPIIILIISYFAHTKGDAQIGIVLGGIILIYQYFYLQICVSSINIANEKELDQMILNILTHLYSSNKLFFISTLIFILRFIII